MKRIVFSIALLTVLTVISFAATSKIDSNYKQQTSTSRGFNNAKPIVAPHHIIHLVDHFTI